MTISETYADIEILFENYISYYSITHSIQVIRNEQLTFRRFFSVCRIKTYKDITLFEVLKYQQYLYVVRGQQLTTQHYEMSVIKRFLNYLLMQGFEGAMDPNRVPNIKVPERKLQKILSDVLVEEILKISKENNLQHYSMFRTLVETGLRLSELCDLNLEDLGPEITVRGKGGRVRLVFLSETTIQAINEYVKKRKSRNPAMFVDQFGGRVTYYNVQYIVKKYGHKIGIPELHPHMFRHYFATKLLRSGVDIVTIKSLMGHRDIATTMIYTTITNENLRESHKKVFDNLFNI